MGLDFDRLDASNYLKLLNGLLIFHTAVAKFSQATVTRELGVELAPFSRVPALRADIELCSERQPTIAAGACAPGRGLDTAAFAGRLRGGREARIGASYVAAGSVLGGRVIAANLAASECDFPRSFFASDQLDYGRLWRDFKAALDDFGASGVDFAQVIAGALTAFALVRDILEWPDVSSAAQ